jgi:hypothetical protein
MLCATFFFSPRGMRMRQLELKYTYKYKYEKKKNKKTVKEIVLNAAKQQMWAAYNERITMEVR